MRRASVSIPSNIAEGYGRKLYQIMSDHSILPMAQLAKLKHKFYSQVIFII